VQRDDARISLRQSGATAWSSRNILEGPEVSVLSFTDGTTLVPMVSRMDHKRAHDGDTGLNTGGMGAVAPNPYYTPAIAAQCMEKIFLPTIRAMKAEGATFRGCLYFGLMLTNDGPKVIEYNCRFGDPETQVVLPLLKSDLLTVMQAPPRTAGWPRREVRLLARRRLLRRAGLAAAIPHAYEKGCASRLPTASCPTPRASPCSSPAKRGEDGSARHRRRPGAGRDGHGPDAGAAPWKRPMPRQGRNRRLHATAQRHTAAADIGARARLGGLGKGGPKQQHMVYRIYVEKKPGFAGEATASEGRAADAAGDLGADGPAHPEPLRRGGHQTRSCSRVRQHGLQRAAAGQLVYDDAAPHGRRGLCRRVSARPVRPAGRLGRASASSCSAQGERPLVRSARVYLPEGALTRRAGEAAQLCHQPGRGARGLHGKAKRRWPSAIVPPHRCRADGLPRDGRRRASPPSARKAGLAMDADDLAFCHAVFRGEHRDPTITELRMIDTYWSDHCRHTTFGTIDRRRARSTTRVQAAYERYLAARRASAGRTKPRA
jgi:hypothetical protein